MRDKNRVVCLDIPVDAPCTQQHSDCNADTAASELLRASFRAQADRATQRTSGHYYRTRLYSKPFVPAIFGPETINGFYLESNN